MADDDDDTADTADLSTPALDRITAAMALLDFVAELHDLAINGKAYKAGLKKLRRLERDIAVLERNIAAARTQAAELVAKAESAVKAIHDEARRRLDAVESAEQELTEREPRIAQLEQSWRGLGEPADVMSGFRAAEYSPLQKARMAHGQPPGRDPDRLLFAEPDAAPDHVIDAYIRRDVGDERSDAQGNAFAPSSLTRSIEHKRGAA
jgi:hypothetical protein